MKILTKDSLIKAVPQIWFDQYGSRPNNTKFVVIYEKLVELGENLTEQNVNEIIGNTCWTKLRCHNCNKDVSVVAVYNDGEYNHCLCKKCLKNALKEMK